MLGRWRTPPKRPIACLAICFILWKTVLMALALISPGLGYDTSSTLLLEEAGLGADVGGSLSALITRLMRWDAIYFAKVSERGYVYEQEWAWGWGFTRLLSFIVKACSSSPATVKSYVWAGVIVSHVSHFASTIILYFLAERIYPSRHYRGTAFAAATLHIFSPAGICLSAPYTESLFAFLSFAGVSLLLHSTCGNHERRNFSQDLSILAAGVILGIATTVRSNGIFNGLIIAYEFTHELIRLLRDVSYFPTWRRLVCLGLAGVFLSAGFALPQAVAFSEICKRDSHGKYPRAWCGSRPIPSVYTWVQKYYWGIGLLRYWTISNIPLFILSGPMLYVLLTSAVEHLSSRDTTSNRKHRGGHHGNGKSEDTPNEQTNWKLDLDNSKAVDQAALHRLALPQLAIALLALTYFHVQIINRISSGYPLWYIWIASQSSHHPSTHEQTPQETGSPTKRRSGQRVQIIVRGMIIYAIIHAGLFSSFLPPA